MDDKDGFGSGPPPVGALGNYKGVMLCNRPVDDPSRPQGMGQEPWNVKPFKSTISATYRDPLGLPACKEAEGPVIEVKSRGPSAALRRHVRWIKELQEQVREDQKRVGEDEQRADQRKSNMQEVFKKQRDAVRAMRQEKEVLDRDELVAIMEAYPPTGAKVKGVKKPKWAMTEKEKEENDELEAAELINFAENLDFDKYVHDLEFRSQLQVMRNRAYKLQKEQDAFKDDILREFNQSAAEDDYEGSEVGSRVSGVDGVGLIDDGADVGQARGMGGRRHRRYADGDDPDRPDWDASTACSDAPGRSEASHQAKAMLEMNPHLRAIHSKDSVQKLIDKARSEAPPATPSSQAL